MSACRVETDRAKPLAPERTFSANTGLTDRRHATYVYAHG